jgi:hypothetical protein
MHDLVKNLLYDVFNPSDRSILEKMRAHALNLSLEEKNFLRFHYYSEKDAPRLIVVFDNIDQFTGSEQNTIIDYCRRLAGGISGISLILTIRPQTTTVKSRMSDFFGDGHTKFLVMKCPDIYDILARRLTTDRHGNNWPLKNLIPNSDISWVELLNIYKKSDNFRGLAGFIRDLCSTTSLSSISSIKYSVHTRSTDYGKDYYDKLDVRYYLKLFRRILRSNCLKTFKNIGNLYYGVQSLMIRDGGRMEEAESYLFNLFDNEKPHLPGNALIRYRVLEYFKTIRTLDNTFDEYFDALGYGAENARRVLTMFIDTNLVDLVNNNLETPGEPVYGVLTIPGERHLEIISNMWYMICIKTGMNIYEDCILYGEKAKEMAKQFVHGKSLLSFYGTYGWVPEEKFINFIADQERLETLRLEQFLSSNPNPKLIEKITNLVGFLSEPKIILFDSFHTQMKYWDKSKVK